MGGEADHAEEGVDVGEKDAVEERDGVGCCHDGGVYVSGSVGVSKRELKASGYALEVFYFVEICSRAWRAEEVRDPPAERQKVVSDGELKEAVFRFSPTLRDGSLNYHNYHNQNS